MLAKPERKTDKTPVGCKRTEPRQPMKRTGAKMKAVSPKLEPELRKYYRLRAELIALAGGKSELNNQFGAGDTHHILKRGKNLCNPFTILVCTRNQHDLLELYRPVNGVKYTKEQLLEIVRPLRLAQGYKPEDYE